MFNDKSRNIDMINFQIAVILKRPRTNKNKIERKMTPLYSSYDTSIVTKLQNKIKL